MGAKGKPELQQRLRLKREAYSSLMEQTKKIPTNPPSIREKIQVSSLSPCQLKVKLWTNEAQIYSLGVISPSL